MSSYFFILKISCLLIGIYFEYFPVVNDVNINFYLNKHFCVFEIYLKLWLLVKKRSMHCNLMCYFNNISTKILI